MQHQNDPAPNPYQFPSYPRRKNSPLLVGAISVLILFTLGIAAYSFFAHPMRLGTSGAPSLLLTFDPVRNPQALVVGIRSSGVSTSTYQLPQTLQSTLSAGMFPEGEFHIGTTTYYELFDANNNFSNIYRLQLQSGTPRLIQVTNSHTYKSHFTSNPTTNTVAYESSAHPNETIASTSIMILSLDHHTETSLGTGSNPQFSNGTLFIHKNSMLQQLQPTGEFTPVVALAAHAPYAVTTVGTALTVALYNAAAKSVDYFTHAGSGWTYAHSTPLPQVPGILVYMGTTLYAVSDTDDAVQITAVGTAKEQTIAKLVLGAPLHDTQAL